MPVVGTERIAAMIDRSHPKLVIYGDIAIDVTIEADHTPLLGQDAADTRIALLPGGSAANCAATAARLGAPVEFVGVTGSDFLARILVEDMQKHQVGIQHLKQTSGPTAIVAVIVHAGGERTFYSFRGAATTIRYGPIADGLIQRGDCLHLSGYSFQDERSRETAMELIAAARRVGAWVSLDPSFHSAQDFRDKQQPVLRAVDIIFPNETEALRMTGHADPERAAAAIHELGPRLVVVKRGEQGCLVFSAAERIFVPAYPTENVVDTTGAGDAFCGGCLTGLLYGMTPREAARCGHAAAACVVAMQGGHTGAATITEVIRFLREYDDAATISAIQRTGLVLGERSIR